ncbi:MAG: hypothetical protein LBH60_02945 [Prevotellaceae bacterium]|nr:hypothetical protein [Prevotellaceae bacterium]
MKRILLFLILGLACTVYMTSCENDNAGPGEVPLTEISVNVADDIISENVRYDSVTVTVNVSPVPANATDVNFQWTTKDPTVAFIKPEEELGVRKIIVCKEGETVIAVSSGSVEKEIKVIGRFDIIELDTIKLTVPNLKADTTVDVTVGDIINATAFPEPLNANTRTSDTVALVWSSNNEAVATVEQNGNQYGEITVVGKGEAVITVSCDDYEKVKVKFTVVAKEPE